MLIRNLGAGPGEILHTALRGAVAAMAMSGMRTVTVGADVVEATPPDAMAREGVPGLLGLVPPDRRTAAIEVAHWTYGAAGGAMFGALPDTLRRRGWAGPVYGMALWLGFEVAIAPALGLHHAHGRRPAERAAFAADHLLYGLVLSELRRQPQEAR